MTETDPIQALFDGHRRFKSGYFRSNRELFARLAQGQSPSLALVSCCDSRVDPAILFDCDPGQIFMIRNVANLVPPREEGGLYHGTSAALEFAVAGLHVTNIAVMGHSRCGGIQALLAGPQGSDTPLRFVDAWMSIAEPARNATLAAEGLDAAQRQAMCERAAIRLSLENLRTFPTIRARESDGELRLHGWHFDVATGSLQALDPRTGKFALVAD